MCLTEEQVDLLRRLVDKEMAVARDSGDSIEHYTQLLRTLTHELRCLEIRREDQGKPDIRFK